MPNTTTNTTTAATPSKKEIAGNLYATMTAAGKPRKEILLAMIQAGLTTAGAATYYNNFHSGAWSTTATPAADATAAEGVVETTAVPTVKLADMKMAELVELHNAHSATAVKKFKDRATAIRRVSEVLTASA